MENQHSTKIKQSKKEDLPEVKSRGGTKIGGVLRRMDLVRSQRMKHRCCEVGDEVVKVWIAP